MSDVLYSLIDHAIIKTITSLILTAVAFFFGEGMKEILMALVMLFVFDSLTGVARTVKQEMGGLGFSHFRDAFIQEKITSRRFFKSSRKAAIYFTGISASHFTELITNTDLIMKAVIFYTAATEFLSVMENIRDMGYNTPDKVVDKVEDMQSRLSS